MPLWELQDLLERALAAAPEDGGARGHPLPAPGCLTGRPAGHCTADFSPMLHLPHC